MDVELELYIPERRSFLRSGSLYRWDVPVKVLGLTIQKTEPLVPDSAGEDGEAKAGPGRAYFRSSGRWRSFPVARTDAPATTDPGTGYPVLTRVSKDSAADPSPCYDIDDDFFYLGLQGQWYRAPLASTWPADAEGPILLSASGNLIGQSDG